MKRNYFLYITIAAAVLAFGVAVPSESEANSALLAARPLEPARAWKEMIHRYFVGGLGTLILALAVIAFWRRREPDQPKLLPGLLLALVVFQALLGMWTVPLLLSPPVVTAHLLGGLATFTLLVLLVWQSGGWLRHGAAAMPE